MSFDDLLSTVNEKLKEIEEDINDDEVPPWVGENNETRSYDNVTVEESDTDLSITIEIPGYPERDITVEYLEKETSNDELVVSVLGDDNYRFSLAENVDKMSVRAEYNAGLLKITAEKAVI